MLRPIERRIFEQTKDWLAAHKDNQLTLVLDEAHLYRGTGGAEVAMLIRRLMARLGISRDKLRCILTSASMGKGKLDVYKRQSPQCSGPFVVLLERGDTGSWLHKRAL